MNTTTITEAVTPVLAADVVLFAPDNNAVMHVLLLEGIGDPSDPDDPFDGCWTLPGGFLNLGQRETFETAARRELFEGTGIPAPAVLLPVGVFDDPDRDPRDRVISAAYTGLLESLVEPTADSYTAAWVPVDEVGYHDLAIDHADIVRAAVAAYPNPHS